jgi:3-oxo-5alpha-steroid 4-dehydrogenase
MQPDHRFLPDLSDTCTRVEPARIVDSAENEAWDLSCDVLVVGVGLAGVSAALRAAEDPALEVVAVDRGLGGGTSAQSGGVLYLGGTRVQQEAGVEDSPENMAKYLAMETGNVVTSETVRRFAHASAAFVPWLERYGARFGGPATEDKTSYPRIGYLYFSGNEATPEGRALATPAQRGHRAKPAPGARPGPLSGQDLMRPLVASLARQPNVRLLRQTRATRLIVDGKGAVVGAELSRIPPGLARMLHSWLYALGANPILGVLGLAAPAQRWAARIERSAARPMRIWARKGVVLAAGGFAYNRAMIDKIAPAYSNSAPLGTIADDGSGIKLGMTAGAAVNRMPTISAWRFFYPPAAWTEAVCVGQDGERLLSEELYGARTGEAIFERAGGKAWLVLDAGLQAKVAEQAKGKELHSFQRMQLKSILDKHTVSADTLAALAAKIGAPPERLVATMEAYNRAIREGAPDPLGKSDKRRVPLDQGPFYATDVGYSVKLSPIFALTMGGLVVDEETGQVLDAGGRAIPGLFAAGRTAVGMCSGHYVSGLSLSDCVWSGCRAAETLKGNGGARALAPDMPEPLAAA